MSPKNDSSKRGLSQEDTQKLALGAVVALGLLAGFWQLAWKPLSTRIAARNKEVAKAQKAYQTARRLTDVAPAIATQYETARNRLTNIMKAQMPPPVNATAWASDLFMQTAMSDSQGVNILSIGNRGLRRQEHKKNTAAPLFEECLFDVSLTATYHAFGRFLAQLEKNNPFFRVESLSVAPATSAAAKKEHKLAINMLCAFPRLTEDGFPPEERPDAESPHVRKKAKSK